MIHDAISLLSSASLTGFPPRMQEAEEQNSLLLQRKCCFSKAKRQQKWNDPENLLDKNML